MADQEALGHPPEGINVLLETLEEHVDKLDELGERLHGERFLSTFRFENDWDSYDRTTFSEKEWKELCEQHGVDPARDEFVLPLELYVVPLDAEVAPSPGLTQLIAMYALRNVSQEPLLNALHPDPSEVNQAGLRKDIREIRHYAGRVAKRVHGGTINDGGSRPAPPISRYELRAKWDCIDPLRGEGYSDEEILDKLNAYRYSKEDGEAFSLDDVRRLAGLRLPPPS